MFFCIFKPQPGEKTPAYSFMKKSDMEQAVGKGIIDKSYVVPDKDIHSKEEVLELLKRYQTENV